LAAHLKLDNLVVIVDQNNSNPVKLSDQTLVNVFTEFGWLAYGWRGEPGVAQGAQNLSQMFISSQKPTAYIAGTIKGEGCKPMEDAPEMWHHRVISDEELPMLLESVK
jgi:transketolase